MFHLYIFYSNYDKNAVSPINELHEKGRLSYDDILATAETHDTIFHQTTDDDFIEKWFFVTSYTTDNGNILLLSDYEGDLFFRKKQSRILGWIEDDMSKKIYAIYYI